MAAAFTQSNPARLPFVVPSCCVGASNNVRILRRGHRDIGGAAVAKTDKKFLAVSPHHGRRSASCRAHDQRSSRTTVKSRTEGSRISRHSCGICCGGSTILAPPESEAERGFRVEISVESEVCNVNWLEQPTEPYCAKYGVVGKVGVPSGSLYRKRDFTGASPREGKPCELEEVLGELVSNVRMDRFSAVTTAIALPREARRQSSSS